MSINIKSTNDFNTIIPEDGDYVTPASANEGPIQNRIDINFLDKTLGSIEDLYDNHNSTFNSEFIDSVLIGKDNSFVKYINTLKSDLGNKTELFNKISDTVQAINSLSNYFYNIPDFLSVLKQYEFNSRENFIAEGLYVSSSGVETNSSDSNIIEYKKVNSKKLYESNTLEILKERFLFYDKKDIKRLIDSNIDNLYKQYKDLYNLEKDDISELINIFISKGSLFLGGNNFIFSEDMNFSFPDPYFKITENYTKMSLDLIQKRQIYKNGVLNSVLGFYDPNNSDSVINESLDDSFYIKGLNSDIIIQKFCMNDLINAPSYIRSYKQISISIQDFLKSSNNLYFNSLTSADYLKENDTQVSATTFKIENKNFIVQLEIQGDTLIFSADEDYVFNDLFNIYTSYNEQDISIGISSFDTLPLKDYTDTTSGFELITNSNSNEVIADSLQYHSLGTLSAKNCICYYPLVQYIYISENEKDLKDYKEYDDNRHYKIGDTIIFQNVLYILENNDSYQQSPCLSNDWVKISDTYFSKEKISFPELGIKNYIIKNGKYIDINTQDTNFYKETEVINSDNLNKNSIYLARIYRFGKAEPIIYQNEINRNVKAEDIKDILDSIINLQQEVLYLDSVKNQNFSTKTQTTRNLYVCNFQDDIDLGLLFQDDATISNINNNSLTQSINFRYIKFNPDKLYSDLNSEKTSITQEKWTGSNYINEYVVQSDKPIYFKINPSPFITWKISKNIYSTKTTCNIDWLIQRNLCGKNYKVYNILRSEHLSGWYESYYNPEKYLGSKVIKKTYEQISGYLPQDRNITIEVENHGALNYERYIIQIQSLGIKEFKQADADGAFSVNLTIPKGTKTGVYTVSLKSLDTNKSSEQHIFIQEYEVSKYIEKDYIKYLYYFDPLANTFKSLDNHYISSTEVIFQLADENGKELNDISSFYLPSDIEVGLFGTTAGFPDEKKYLGYARVPKGTLLNNTTFHKIEFDRPIKVQKDVTYAVCFFGPYKSEGVWWQNTNNVYKNYRIKLRVAELGKYTNVNSVSPSTKITRNAYTNGILLNSSNRSTWSPIQNKDLAFRINTSDFKNSTPVIYTKSGSTDYTNVTHVSIFRNVETNEYAYDNSTLNLGTSTGTLVYDNSDLKELIPLDSKTDLTSVDFSTELISTNGETAHLKSAVVVGLGTIETESEYITKNIDFEINDSKYIQVVLNLETGDISNVDVYYSKDKILSDNTWKKFNISQAGDFENDYIYSTPIKIDISNYFRLKLVLKTDLNNISSSPKVNSLRCLLSDFDVN